MSLSSEKFCFPEDIEMRNSETTINEKEEMQEYEKRILQCVLAEKIIPMDLKHWPCFHVLKPEFITQIHMFTVYDEYNDKAIIVTKDKNVYSLSYNEDGCSMTSDIHIAPDLKKIEALCGKNIKTFTCGLNFILVLTEEGKVYFCKFDKQHRGFTERGPVKSTPRVSCFSTKRIVDIACSTHHFLFLTSNGEVCAWGNRYYKQLLYGNKNAAIAWQVNYELEKKNVVHIACGEILNMVITDENKLYGWGTNKKGQISTIQSQEQYVYPREITTFSDKIIKMVCGYAHTLALTNKGEIYAWGDNSRGQIGVNNNLISSDPIMVNVPQMGKVLNVDAYGHMSVAVGYDRTIYVWGGYFSQNITQPFPTKFSRIFDVFAYSVCRRMDKPMIVHDSVHTVRISNNYNYKYTEEILNILDSLGAAFDDPLTSDFTIQVERQPIYVHKAILNIRCQYFRNMFHHDCAEDVQSTSDSSAVYTVSDKFSYIVYIAFLKYLYTGTINLPLENTLELMELAELYCETNLKKDCSQIMKQTITVSNVAFFYSKAIEYNAKELEEFCFQFALSHTANTLSEDYIKLDMSTQAKFIHRAAIQNDVTITSSTFYSPNKNVEKRNSETTSKKIEMQKNEKRILQCVLAEKIISMDIKYWPFFHVLKPEFISQIHMVMVYSTCVNGVIIVTKDKNVYSLDFKEEHLKTGDIYTALYLKEIKELCGKNIKTVAHGHTFILALTEEGEVYFCEIAEKTIFSRRISSISTFIRVVGLSDKLIVDIGCGQCHGLALTSDGEVYAWGENDWEEDDLEESDWEENDSQVDNENEAHFSVPRQVKHELENKKVVHIACGSIYNIAVTDENKLYGWGYNWGGQISIVQSQECYKYPHEISGYNKQISDKIVKVVCGEHHALALTNKGEVYAWGDNSYGQVGVNNNRKPCGPTVVNVPEMGKVLDIAAYGESSVAIGYDRIIYVWGHFYYKYHTPIPFPTKYSKIHDVFAHSLGRFMFKPLIVFTNNFKYVEEVLNILEILKTTFDDPLTSDLTIRVEGRPIYVHKAILKIRCQYFKNMFQHDWIENIQSISDSVYTVSDTFSYVVYKAFLKYLYTGIIDLPSENALELMQLADIYCVTNLIKDSSEIIKKAITVSNVVFFYNKAIECNAKELEEFCFQFALRHMKAVVLSEDFIKLDTSTKDNFMRRAAEGNTFGISFF